MKRGSEVLGATTLDPVPMRPLPPVPPKAPVIPPAIEAVADGEVDRLVDVATAELERLRRVLGEANDRAEEAEGSHRAQDDAETCRLLISQLSEGLAWARDQLRREIEVARTDAALRVGAAQAEGALLLAAAKVRVRIAEDGMTQLISMPGVPAQALCTNGTRRLGSAAPNVPPVGERAPPRDRVERTGIRRFFSVDTVLPTVAILIVLVILVAWLG